MVMEFPFLQIVFFLPPIYSRENWANLKILLFQKKSSFRLTHVAEFTDK